MHLFFALLQSAEAVHPVSGTGLEWMVIASLVIPAILLAVLVYLGSKRTV